MPGLFKKIIAIFTVLFLISCGETREDSGKLSVTVTIPPYKYLVEKIAGNKIDVVTSIPVGVTPHHFEPTPKFVQAISKSNYYLSVGRSMEFEHVWLEKLQGINKNLKVFNLSKNIEYKNDDPHVWLSTSRIKIIANNILTALSEISSQDKDLFKSNYNALLDSINIVEKQLGESFEEIQNKKLLVYHGSWAYFADDFGFEQISIELGSKSASANEFKKILDEVRESEIPVIFIDPQHSKASAEVIAKDLAISLESIDPIPTRLLSNLIDVKNKIVKYYK